MAASKKSSQLTGSQRPLRTGSQVIAPTDPDEPIEVTVRLRPRTPIPCAAAIGAVSVHQRKYLSRERFAAVHGSTPEDVGYVRDFARRNQLQVTKVDRAQLKVVLSGRAQAFSDAFRVKLMECAHEQGRYRWQIGPVRLPSEMRGIVQGVFGLDNRRQARPHVAKQSGPAVSPPYGPLQVAGLYNFPGGLNGSGQCIGILEFGGGYLAADLATYFAKLGIPVPDVSAVSVDGAPNQPGLDSHADSEVALDIEIAGAIAPGAKIVVYFAPFTERGWVDALATAVHDTASKPSVISVSWGFSEGVPSGGFEWSLQAVQAINQTLQAAAAMGVSVCVASGDSGSTDGINDGHAHVNFPASSPYVLSCGGSRLTEENEVVWNGGPNSGTGGGISDMNPLPAWQEAIVPASVNPGGKRGRGVPDVCGNADPATGYYVFYGGRPHVLGGTSAVAPLWAALIARINQSLGKPVGYFNPVLYGKLGRTAAFRDITVGTNDTTGVAGGYAAGKGWDACTGWGSPRGSALLVAFRG